MVCHGKGCNVTFTSAMFKSSVLVTMAKAQSTLKDVTLVSVQQVEVVVLSSQV